MVHRVEIDQGVDLAEKVSDRDTHRLVHVGEGHHDVHKAPVLDLSLHQAAQDRAVYGIEELADIELQGVEIPAAAAKCPLGVIARQVRAVALPAGEGRRYERPVEDRVDQPVDCMLYDDVPEGRRPDEPGLGLVNGEFKVWPRLVGPRVQLPVQPLDVGAQVYLKVKAGPLLSLASSGVEVSLVEVFFRKSLVEKIADSFHETLLVFRWNLTKKKVDIDFA